MSDYQSLIHDVWGKALEETVREVIAKHAGYGLNTEVQQVIKEQARKLIEGSPELQQMIFDALKSWIFTQTAEDVRKVREDNRRSR